MYRASSSRRGRMRRRSVAVGQFKSHPSAQGVPRDVGSFDTPRVQESFDVVDEVGDAQVAGLAWTASVPGRRGDQEVVVVGEQGCDRGPDSGGVGDAVEKYEGREFSHRWPVLGRLRGQELPPMIACVSTSLRPASAMRASRL